MSMRIDQVPFPEKIIRGNGAIKAIGEASALLGKKAFVMGGMTALSKTQEQILNSLKEVGISVTSFEWFGGECSRENVKKLKEKVRAQGADFIIAVGGGKAMDTGKLTAYECKLSLVTVPTIAATCAAIASMSVVYNEEGEFIEVFQLGKAPEAIVIDTDIILKAPIRWLAAGLGDTLAKWYEYRVSIVKAPKNGLTLGALANGKLCYDLIEQFGGKAIESARKGEFNEAVDSVVDAIILYAGTASLLGGTTVEAAAAHAFYNGLTTIPATHAAGHGLTVGYGNLILLALENRSDGELKEAIDLAKRCVIPTTLREIAELSNEEKEVVAEAVLANPDMGNMPFPVTKEMLFAAIERVDGFSK